MVKVLCSLVLSLALTSGAQEEATLFSQSDVVFVPTSVRDLDGIPQYGLGAKDFTIEDDGVEQAVRMDETLVPEPISLVVVVQTGRRAKREFSRMRGLSAMLHPVFDQSGSRVAVIQFDSEVHLLAGFGEHEDSIDKVLETLTEGDNGAAIRCLRFSINLLGKSPLGVNVWFFW